MSLNRAFESGDEIGDFVGGSEMNPLDLLILAEDHGIVWKEAIGLSEV